MIDNRWAKNRLACFLLIDIKWMTDCWVKCYKISNFVGNLKQKEYLGYYEGNS